MNIGSSNMIGIDLGLKHIRAVQLIDRQGVPVVSAATSLARTGPVDGPPTRDELMRLRDVLDRQGFRGRRVVIAAPESALFSSVVELPPRSSGAPIEELAAQELARAAKRDASSFEVSSWDVPQPSRAAEGTHVIAVGLSHADAEASMDAFESAGLIVDAIDCRCWALARACAPALSSTVPVASVLELTESAASIVLVHSGVVAYDRPMRESGVSRLRERLMHDLKVDADAADYLLERLLSANGDATVAEQTTAAAWKIIDEFLAGIVQELRSVMAYALHRYPGAVGPVLVTGSGARIGNLAGRVRSELDLDARVVTPSDLAEIPPEMAELGEDSSLVAALGLSLHRTQAIARRAA